MMMHGVFSGIRGWRDGIGLVRKVDGTVASERAAGGSVWIASCPFTTSPAHRLR